MPQTVPNSPTNGAVDPTVASTGSGLAAEFLPNQGKELLPFPQSTLDADPALMQNFGY